MKPTNLENADRDFLLEMLFLAAGLLLLERVIWECPLLLSLMYALPLAAIGLALAAHLFLTRKPE